MVWRRLYSETSCKDEFNHPKSQPAAAMQTKYQQCISKLLNKLKIWMQNLKHDYFTVYYTSNYFEAILNKVYHTYLDECKLCEFIR